jgi:hypothetical protein
MLKEIREVLRSSPKGTAEKRVEAPLPPDDDATESPPSHHDTVTSVAELSTASSTTGVVRGKLASMSTMPQPVLAKNRSGLLSPVTSPDASASAVVKTP